MDPHLAPESGIYREFRDVLRRDVAGLEAEEAGLLARLAVVRGRLVNSRRMVADISRTLGESEGPAPGAAPGRRDRFTHVEAIKMILRAAGSPLSSRGIAARMAALGVLARDGRPLGAPAVNYAISKRRDLFVHVGHRLWGLAESARSYHRARWEPYPEEPDASTGG